MSTDYLADECGEAPIRLHDNSIAFLENVLNEHELQKLVEFGKSLSMFNFDKAPLLI